MVWPEVIVQVNTTARERQPPVPDDRDRSLREDRQARYFQCTHEFLTILTILGILMMIAGALMGYDGFFYQDRIETSLDLMRWGFVLFLIGLIGLEVLGHLNERR